MEITGESDEEVIENQKALKRVDMLKKKTISPKLFLEEKSKELLLQGRLFVSQRLLLPMNRRAILIKKILKNWLVYCEKLIKKERRVIVATHNRGSA